MTTNMKKENGEENPSAGAEEAGDVPVVVEETPSASTSTGRIGAAQAQRDINSKDHRDMKEKEDEEAAAVAKQDAAKKQQLKGQLSDEAKKGSTASTSRDAKPDLKDPRAAAINLALANNSTELVLSEDSVGDDVHVNPELSSIPAPSLMQQSRTSARVEPEAEAQHVGPIDSGNGEKEEAAAVAKHDGAKQQLKGKLSDDTKIGSTASASKDVKADMKDPREAAINLALANKSTELVPSEDSVGDNVDPELSSLPVPSLTGQLRVPAPSLMRQFHTSGRVDVEPGAQHVGPVDSSNMNSWNDPEDPAVNLDPPAEDDDPLVQATLVEEHSPALFVEAHPALEGFKAIVANRKFKYLVALIILAFVAVVVPIAVLVPKSSDGGGSSISPAEVLATTCGTSTLKQSDYRGNISVANDGKTCLPWDTQEPEVLRLGSLTERFEFDPANYPSSGLVDNNYCRNPDGLGDRAWCVVVHALGRRGRYCDVPYCEGAAPETMGNVICGSRSKQQADYRGAIAVTASGKTCQRWDSQEPHVHQRTPETYAGAGLLNNYCRNPDGEDRAWCYTTDNDTRWEFCTVPFCGAMADYIQVAEICYNCTTSSCGSFYNEQADYRGLLNTTENGRTCQRWDVQEPHRHRETTAADYPNSDLTDNYCRNPDQSERAWCYTTDAEVRWEFCTVPLCDEATLIRTESCGSRSQRQADYYGTFSVTETGKTCQSWGSQEPHKHKFTSKKDRARYSLESNYCRNPDGEERAWCYTTDPDTLWEYCTVPYCTEEVGNYNITTSALCGTLSAKQVNYRGGLAETESGKPCQYWDEQELRFEDWIMPELLPSIGLDENFCRNPVGIRERVWCYTGDPDTPWEFCAVPACSEPVVTGHEVGNSTDHLSI